MEQLKSRTAKLFDKVTSQLGKYSHFKTELTDNKLYISGTLDIGYGPHNSFEIEIIISQGYPNKIPEVHETGGRIPPVLDRHYMTNGTGCCLVMPHRYTEYFKPFMTIEDFIDVLVVPYFQNQIYYEINGQFATGYEHGEFGVWEYYFEIFGGDLTLEILFKLIRAVIDERRDGKERIKGHRSCPCGSGIIQRHCHGSGLIKLKVHGNSSTMYQSLHLIYRQSLRDYKKIIHGGPIQQPNNGLIIYNFQKISPLSERLSQARMYDFSELSTKGYILKPGTNLQDLVNSAQ